MTRAPTSGRPGVMLLSLAGYRAALPQAGRMITGADAGAEEDACRRAAVVVEAACRLTSPSVQAGVLS